MTKPNIPASDEAWDERVLGHDEGFVQVAEEAQIRATDEGAGTQSICVRMQKSMIDDLKAIAARNGGMGYQTLMKQILQRFIDGEKRMLWNEFVTEKLKEQRQTIIEECTHTPSKTKDRKVA